MGRGSAEAADNNLARTGNHPAPDFALDLLSGGRRSLADEAGRAVLLHFFATWCEPCRPEMASLDRLAGRFGGTDLAILAISVAEVEARLTRFFAESPVRFPILLDRDRKVSRAWEVEALPTTFLVGRDGKPRMHVRGDLDWQRPEVEAEIASLLADDGAPQPQRFQPRTGG